MAGTSVERHSLRQRGGALFKSGTKGDGEHEGGEEIEVQGETEQASRGAIRAQPSEHRHQDDFSA